MSNNNSDKSLVIKLTVGCLLAIIGFQIGFALTSYAKFSSFAYIALIIGFMAAWVYLVRNAFKQADSGTKDNSSRITLVLFTIVILLFMGIWSSGGNEKVEPGSPQMEGNV